MKIEVLPNFKDIDISKVRSKLEDNIKNFKADVTELISIEQPPTWQNFYEKLSVFEDRFDRFISPFIHLTGVKDSEEIRKVYEEILPIMSGFGTWLGQNNDLAKRVDELKASPEFETMTQAQKRSIELCSLGFTLSGVNLPDDKKKRFAEISERSSKLSHRFSTNVLDATKSWVKHITDKTELKGIPESAMALYKQAAESRELQGWVITLDFPSYGPVMQYCESRIFREELYRVQSTRATKQNPWKDEYDNSDIMEELLTLRAEAANLLNYNNYAEVSLVRKMLKSPEQVIDFIREISLKSREKAIKDNEELIAFASKQGIEQLEAWDRSFYIEKLQVSKYNVSDEEIKEYFPLSKVLEGMFNLVNVLYDIDIREEPNDDTWHKDVKFFRVYYQDEHIASLYMDLYSRPEDKRGGAWMDDPITRWTHNGLTQLPVAYNVCNFSPPIGDIQPNLTHSEVETIFHEFGHALQHILTEVDVYDVSGISGVEWDAVELCSQIMENWCWDKTVLTMISSHHKTKQPIPDELYEKMIASKNFMSGTGLLKQMELSLFDMLLHFNDKPNVREILLAVRDEISIVDTPEFNRFENSFSHIFSGGYSAGYYSYIWALVLSDDVFSKFEEGGVLSPQIGNKFRKEIVSQGGTYSMEELFFNFMDRAPNLDAMLRNKGIIE